MGKPEKVDDRHGSQGVPERVSANAWSYVMARSLAPRLVGADGAERHVEDPFTADVLACLKELSRQQRIVLLADLSAGGMASAARLAQELKTSRNTIYVARANGRRAIRLALMKRGYGLGADLGWASPMS